MPQKRHSPDEIASKLLQSDKLAEEGKPQVEIARALGVSVMTYHRWRKTRNPRLADPSGYVRANGNGAADTIDNTGLQRHDDGDLLNRISDLHAENSRLRRLITDQLLETDRLEEKLAIQLDLRSSARKDNDIARRAPKRRAEVVPLSGKTR